MLINLEGKLVPLGHRYESVSTAKRSMALLRKIAAKSTTID
jgi:hypothetical protein